MEHDSFVWLDLEEVGAFRFPACQRSIPMPEETEKEILESCSNFCLANDTSLRFVNDHPDREPDVYDLVALRKKVFEHLGIERDVVLDQVYLRFSTLPNVPVGVFVSDAKKLILLEAGAQARRNRSASATTTPPAVTTNKNTNWCVLNDDQLCGLVYKCLDSVCALCELRLETKRSLIRHEETRHGITFDSYKNIIRVVLAFLLVDDVDEYPVLNGCVSIKNEQLRFMFFKLWGMVIFPNQLTRAFGRSTVYALLNYVNF